MNIERVLKHFPLAFPRLVPRWDTFLMTFRLIFFHTHKFFNCELGRWRIIAVVTIWPPALQHKNKSATMWDCIMYGMLWFAEDWRKYKINFKRDKLIYIHMMETRGHENVGCSSLKIIPSFIIMLSNYFHPSSSTWISLFMNSINGRQFTLIKGFSSLSGKSQFQNHLGVSQHQILYRI